MDLETKLQDAIENLKRLIDSPFQVNNLTSSNVLHYFESEEILFKIIENNLKSSSFRNKQWSLLEMPYLTIFSDSKIDLKYHLLLSNTFLKENLPSTLLHDHGDYILVSRIVFGKGYKMIYRSNKKFKMANHERSMEYRLKSRTEHLITNPDGFTVSCVLWIKDDVQTNRQGERSIYLPERQMIRRINDDDYMKMLDFDENELITTRKYIHAFCYFMQKVGYNNLRFLEKIKSSLSESSDWVFFLNKITSNQEIIEPKIQSDIHLLGYNQLTINDYLRFKPIPKPDEN